MNTPKHKSKPTKAIRRKVGATRQTDRSARNKGTKAPRKPTDTINPWTWPEKEAWSLKVRYRPDLTKLKRTILAHGGDRFQRNDFLSKQFPTTITKRLLAEGRFLTGPNAIVFAMEPSGCHLNAILLGCDPRAERWVGFALSDDGIWRAHSWVVRKRDRRVIETTEKRTMYFGAQLPVGDESKTFYATHGLGNCSARKALFEDPLKIDTPDHPSI